MAGDTVIAYQMGVFCDAVLLQKWGHGIVANIR
jgi:hypothetical protein